MSLDQSTATAYATPQATWFGHPRGLATLFFTEMWERFSYYGMRALLILFMTAAATGANPGLGFGEGTSGAIYGLYTSMVYLLALPGGWIADNLWGQRKAVFVGGVIIAIGHFTLAAPLVGAPDLPAFFLGLFFIVVGTGLLKPNVSTMVGDLYPTLAEDASEADRSEWGARRDAAFSIFYMGINIGAMLGPFICSTLGETWNWHWGFSAAGFGMILGLVQYRMGDKYLGQAGLFQSNEAAHVVQQRARNVYMLAAVAAAAAAFVVWMLASGTLDLVAFVTWVGYGILLLVILFFAYLIFGTKWSVGLGTLFAVLVVSLLSSQGSLSGQWATIGTFGVFVVMCGALILGGGEKVTVEKKRLMVIFWLFILAAIFWSGFEQAGSSLNLFANDLTDRDVPGLAAIMTLITGGPAMPAGYLQNVNPFLIVVLAPVFGSLWVGLAQRNRNPSIPMKFALGLFGLAGGFFVIAWGASYASATNQVSMAWLIVTYFLFTCGELALSPVGLSAMTKLAPPGRLGQMMGVWFIAAALGNLFAGLVAGALETLSPEVVFRNVALFTVISGFGALILAPWVKRLTGGIQ